MLCINGFLDCFAVIISSVLTVFYCVRKRIFCQNIIESSLFFQLNDYLTLKKFFQ